MAKSRLFSPAVLGGIPLKNRMVMAPMTRCRAEGNLPNALLAEYYRQRAGAGLIITEGTSPSHNGLGYARMPGLFSEAQIIGWQKVTAAVRAAGGRIFAQIMHTGRVGHPLNLPPGAELLAPSAIAAPGNIHTDRRGMQPHPVPREMNAADLAGARGEYARAAKNAIAAGFDGVELHAANGYLLEQFMSPHTNQRTDAYGGTIDRRLRFVIEIARAVSEAIGGARMGVRLSPHGVNAGMAAYDDTDATHLALVRSLVDTGIQYIHVVDHSSMGAPPLPEALQLELRRAWPRTVIASGGFDRTMAEAALREGKADLVAFGRAFLSNPDLVDRLEKDLPLNEPNLATFYTPGPSGYTDYPSHGRSAP